METFVSGRNQSAARKAYNYARLVSAETKVNQNVFRDNDGQFAVCPATMPQPDEWQFAGTVGIDGNVELA